MAEVKWLTNGMVDGGDPTGEFPAEAQIRSPELEATVEAVNLFAVKAERASTIPNNRRNHVFLEQTR